MSQDLRPIENERDDLKAELERCRRAADCGPNCTLEEAIYGIIAAYKGCVERAELAERLLCAERKKSAPAVDGATYQKLVTMAQAYQAALQMSDTEHPSFKGSCADVVEFLWEHKETVDELVARTGEHQPAAPKSQTQL